MSSRLGYKLREIISEVTKNTRSDYAASLTEEHREGLLLGKKVYAIDNVNSGITIFMPWKLHSPLENFYRYISGNGEMSVQNFKELVDIASLFPKSQSMRKKSDIMEYILSKVVIGKETLNFEDFLHALFLLSKYRASILRVTEQCAFNHLIATLISYGNRIAQDNKCTVDAPTLEDPAEYKQSDVIRSISHSSLSSKQTNSSVSTPVRCESPCCEKALEFVPDKDADVIASETASPSGATVSRTPSVMSHTKSSQDYMEASRAEQLFKMTEDKMNETCEIMKNEIVNLRNQLSDYKVQESNKKQLLKEISDFKDERAHLMERIESEKAVAQGYKKQLDDAIREAEEKYKSMQSVIERLEAEIASAKHKIQVIEDLRAHNQQVQSMLAMQPEYETMLFSVFLSYRNEEVVNGEFVMAEENCIAFCMDFGLDDMQTSVNSSEEPVAKLAFREVCQLAPEGKLTYGFFKEFLLRLAEILDPQSTQKRAFQLLLMNTIFRRVEENRNACQQNYRHFIHPDEFGRLPYDTHPELQECQLPIINNSEDDVCPDGYMDVEGRMWFEREHEHLLPQSRSGAYTPRFPD